MRKVGLLVLATVLTLAADKFASPPVPPTAKSSQRDRSEWTQARGQLLLAARQDEPRGKAYLESENAYTDAVMKPTEPLQKKLYDEMLGRIKETDVEVPYKKGDYFYYMRTEAGKQYPIRCRRKGSMDAPEEVLLDVNELAKGQIFMSLGEFEVSDDGNLLAYTTDNTGFRQYMLAVKDLRTGKSCRTMRRGSGRWHGRTTTRRFSIRSKMRRPNGNTECIGTRRELQARILWSMKRKTSDSTCMSGSRAARLISFWFPRAIPPAKLAMFQPTSPWPNGKSWNRANRMLSITRTTMAIFSIFA